MPADGLGHGGTDYVFGMKDVARMSRATSATESSNILHIQHIVPPRPRPPAGNNLGAL